MKTNLLRLRPSWYARREYRFKRSLWRRRIGNRWVVWPTTQVDMARHQARLGGLGIQWWYGKPGGRWKGYHLLFMAWGKNNLRWIRV